MALNISLGSYVSDGVRTGPIFTGQLPAGLVADNNGVLVSGNYLKYGPGVLLSTQNTYNISPSPPSPTAGFNILNNVVADTPAADVTAPGYLPLRGDGASTYYTIGSDGFPVIVFDVPRVPTVTISGADAQVNTRVTIFGTDTYDHPLQHTYIVQAQQTYPLVTQGAGAVAGTISLPCKAFKTVNKVFISAALPVGSIISVGASDIFGLPYVVDSSAMISSIQWGTQTSAVFPNTNPITKVSELTTRVIGDPLTTVGIFVPSDISTPSATSGDVRGLYAVSSPASIQYAIVGGQPFLADNKRLVFTVYIQGEDTWINQQANAQQQYMQFSGSSIPQGIPVIPLDALEAYGLPQFYTGIPS